MLRLAKGTSTYSFIMVLSVIENTPPQKRQPGGGGTGLLTDWLCASSTQPIRVSDGTTPQTTNSFRLSR